MTAVSHLDKYRQMFEREMSHSDPLQQSVLKGHLIIEAALDNILSTIFFHPEHVFKGRFSFMQKVQMARAYGLRKDTNTIWQLILSVNEVRNEVAHNLAGERRDVKLKQLRRLLEAEMTNEMRCGLAKGGMNLTGLADDAVVVYSCMLCTGFLGTFEDDVSALRNIIDGLDHILSPEKERVGPKTPDQARSKR